MAKKRRKRKRRPPPPQRTEAAAESTVAVDDRQRTAARSRRAGKDGPPPPPWGSFPLTELVILIGIVLLVAGYFVDPPRGPIMLVTGLTLAALGGLELSVREHFAGYKSHTMVLAGVIGVVTIAVLVAAVKVQPVIAAGCGIAAFAFAAWVFANAFRRRSGGALFRFRA